MRRILKFSLAAIGILAVCIPITFVTTFLLMPLWSRIEARYQIESVGHSGPAEWCFSLVYGVLTSLSLAGLILLARLTKAPEKSTEE